MSVAATVYKTSQQTISSSTFTLMEWTTPLYQDVEMWTVAQPTRMVIPAGGYTHALIVATISWEGSSDFDRIHLLLKDGSPVNGCSGNAYNASSLERTRGHLSAFLEVQEGNYLEVQVWQNTGIDTFLVGADIEAGNAVFFSVELFTS